MTLWNNSLNSAQKIIPNNHDNHNFKTVYLLKTVNWNQINQCLFHVIQISFQLIYSVYLYIYDEIIPKCCLYIEPKTSTSIK